ncbi:N-acetylneuraminate synthase family protein [Pelagibacterales bacterium SAG-MED07]|nr:N-acetylneuraminate synthase family protein [Pelagibacterales bacterium SAG-MED07]
MKSKNIWKGKFGPLIIAEIGGNHEGNFNYAKKLVRLAISSGVDVVKLQIYQGANLVSPIESKKRFKHFKKFELTPNQHISLAKMCQKAKVFYLASVWDKQSLLWIDKYLKFYKIGSGDLTAYPILSELSKRGKPIILSTGLSTMSEVIKTIKFIRGQNKIYENNQYLSLLQCTSSYPTSDNEVNLNVIQNFKKNTNLTIGYSHHNKGDLALVSAYLLGANILEFHFTDTRKGKKFRDHKISLTPTETKQFIEKIKKINLLLGKKEKLPTESEIKSNHLKTFRRAMYFKKDMKKGSLIKEEDLICLRPNHGIDARKYKKLIGKKISKNIKAFSKLN